MGQPVTRGAHVELESGPREKLHPDGMPEHASLAFPGSVHENWRHRGYLVGVAQLTRARQRLPLLAGEQEKRQTILLGPGLEEVAQRLAAKPAPSLSTFQQSVLLLPTLYYLFGKLQKSCYLQACRDPEPLSITIPSGLDRFQVGRASVVHHLRGNRRSSGAASGVVAFILKGKT